MDNVNVGLYVITFNSPAQFSVLLNSMNSYDSDFLNCTTKYLLDNSTDLSTFEEYARLCVEYNFIHIKKDNIGICGGRQFIAQHFEVSGLDYYFFFEDDMAFVNITEKICKNGFNRVIENLYKKSLEIVIKEDFDFLKLNYTEFFGSNSTQWAWYNVPQHVREVLFPDNKYRQVLEVEQSPPLLNYKNIKSLNGVAYATGEVFYCNWPQLVSKKGNKKMFIDFEFQYPYEQTLMSFMYQETVKGLIYPGILLATPTEHHRFEFYNHHDRKEC